MKVKEIMTKDVKSLSGKEIVEDALDLISELKISGLPVVDKDGNLLGMFTEKSILKTVFPSYLSHVGGFVYEENPKNIKKKFSALHKLKVADVMRKEVDVVGEETTLSEAAHIMLVRDIRRIPVLDKEKKVIGIIARCDIVAALKKMAEVND